MKIEEMNLFSSEIGYFSPYYATVRAFYGFILGKILFTTLIFNVYSFFLYMFIKENFDVY